jgi:hypothetical protein
MSTPGSNPHRPVEDDDVDRLQVDARQRVQLSSTNGSCGLTFPAPRGALYYAIVRSTGAPSPATRAKGPHPFPFRTRQLSPSAPMVLHGGLCGRVGRRRAGAASARRLVLFLY